MKYWAAAGLLLVSCTVAVTGQQPDLYEPTRFRSFELKFPSTGWFQQLEQTYPSDVYHKADLKVDGITYENVGVRFRGWKMYRLAARKKPFKISLRVRADKEPKVDAELAGVGDLVLARAVIPMTFTIEDDFAVLYAGLRCDIKSGEEVTVDYRKLNMIAEGIPCWCAEPLCEI